MKRLARTAIGLLGLLAACGGGGVLLKPGATAPELIGEDLSGKQVRLSEQRGEAAVVFFYPKDGTPGCTKEACAFRDAFDAYRAQDIEIFGVSRDDRESHREFQREHKLPFALVPDVDGKLQDAFGVPSRLGMSARVTFLVDGDGKIARVWPEVDPAIHAKEVIAAAREVQ